VRINTWLVVKNDKPRKILDRLGTEIPRTMLDILKRINYLARTKYMTGPYPERLRRGHAAARGTGHGAQAMKPQVTVAGDTIIGEIKVENVAYYLLIWEAVGKYSHRRGRFFLNQTPMHRPFMEPAYEDYKREIINQIQISITRGL